MSNAKPSYVFILPWDLQYPGGVNQVVVNLAKEIESQGELQPVLLTSTWRGQGDDERTGTAPIELRQPVYPHKPLKSVLGFFLLMPWWMPRLLKTLRSLEPSVVNFHYPTLAAWPVLLLRKLGLMQFKAVLSFHGADIDTARKEPWYCIRLWRAMIDQCDHVVVCSEGLAQELRLLAPAMNKVPIVIHNGVGAAAPTPATDAATEKGDSEPSDRFVLSVATYEHKKGIDILLRAFALVAPKFADVSLVLIGREGPQYAALLQLVDDLGLARRVRCLTNVEHAQVMRYHRAATVFVLASRDEPFGIAILEAGVNGVPVVASRVGGIPEIISSPRLGALVEPENVEMLADAMERLLVSEATRHELGQQLRAHVMANFTWQAAGRKYLQLIDLQSAA